MSAASGAASLRPTPNNRFPSGQDGNATLPRHNHEESSVQMVLKNVIGTTTNSANAFAVAPGEGFFACCAGPAVVLSRTDACLNITQQLFRAKYNVSPINTSQSFYNPFTPPSTPAKNRHGSPFKDRGPGMGLTASSDHLPDSPGQARASNRSREATCISLSHGGRLLAVGETGYNPRVLIFSTASDSPSDTPLSVLSDHSFGVASVAFSQDSRWLCTLGNSYDGFILIYSINPKTGSAKLHSSNKCSNVTSVSWMGSSVVSIGTRHVKVWRTESATSTLSSKTPLDLETSLLAVPGSPTPKTFSGRKCLLGPFIDATFSNAVTISDSQTLLCTTSGDICLLDDTERQQRLELVAKLDFGTLCITYDSKNDLVWIAGENGAMRSIHIDDIMKRTAAPISTVSSPSSPEILLPHPEQRSNVLAIGVVCDRVITASSDRIIRFRTAEKSGRNSSFPNSNKRLTAHESTVLGVRSLLPKAAISSPDFLTFSAKGSVIFWLFDGSCTGSVEIALDQPKRSQHATVNELKSLVPSLSDGYLVTGDKYGTLRLNDCLGNSMSVIQAHNGDINGIAVAEGESMTIVASCGRDRTIQIFRECGAKLELLQTLDDHAASVTDVTFSSGLSTLLSISSDRTVCVRKMALADKASLAYICVRVITLKASPISLACVPGEPNLIVVSTMDRQIQRYDMSSGHLLHSFKASDPAINENMLMSSLEIHKIHDIVSPARLLLGVSMTDKSIRIHDYDSGSTLTREHGQTAISAVKLIHGDGDQGTARHRIISCGIDGTVMIWNLLLKTDIDTSSDTSSVLPSPLKRTQTSGKPMRRILSRAELSNFEKSLESDRDTLTTIRNTSPSSAQRKTSRFSLAPHNKTSDTQNPKTYVGVASPVNGRSDRKAPQRYSSKGLSPQNSPSIRVKRPSLDHRRRSKSAANLNDLGETAEQISKSLRTFRKRITSAAPERLDTNMVQELESELSLTSRALAEKVRKNQVGSENLAGDLLDVYLAKMIDERLALKAESDEKKSMTKAPATKSPGDGDEASAGAN